MTISQATRPLLRSAAQPVRALARRGRMEADWLRTRRGAADLAVFHEFRPPPYGGGNQFLLALVRELEGRGLSVEVNRLSGGTPACLFNSFNFDFARLRRFVRDGVRMVHRVDGPIGVVPRFRRRDRPPYRRRQSRARVRDHPAVPVQPRQAPGARARPGRSGRDSQRCRPGDLSSTCNARAVRDRRLRVIATSWSDNPRKGAEILEWLDRNLDLDSYEVTFAGNTQGEARTHPRCRAAAPPSRSPSSCARTTCISRRARTIRARTRCSRRSRAGSPPRSGAAVDIPSSSGRRGSASTTRRSYPSVLAQLAAELDERRAAIHVPALADVADRYLEVLRG